MEKRANYAFVGVSMMILITAVIALVLWLSIGWQHQSYQTYVVYMNQAVTGLKVPSAVNFNGVAVGQVKAIKLNPHNPQQVKLYLKILENTPITTSTVATLANQGITGISYVSLSAKTPDAPPLVAEKGEDYPVIPSVPSFFMQLDTFLTSTSNSMQALLSPENLQNINKILNNLQIVSDKMAHSSDAIADTINNVKVMTANVNQFSMQGKFALGAMDDLLLKLNSLSSEFNNLLNTVQSNPSILVRGVGASQAGPGE